MPTAVASPPMSDLKGKVVLVTGASSGIGAAAARAFGAAGCRVAVHCHTGLERAETVATDVRNAGGDAVVLDGDVTAAGVPRRIVAQTVDAFGRIDILVNNAGGLVARVKVADYDDAYLDAILALNVRQVAYCVREAVRAMRAQGGGGCIINVSSSAARHGGGVGSVIYAATKGFISSATHGWAKELAGDDIRVNAVSPGVIMTPFHEGFTPPEALEASRAAIPQKRIGEARECAGTMLYLASETMSSFVTGQVIEVNGGQIMP